MTIPKIFGPPLFPLASRKQVCFLTQEDGTSLFTLETENGWLAVENCMQFTTFLLELETEMGTIGLETGGSIELENG